MFVSYVVCGQRRGWGGYTGVAMVVVTPAGAGVGARAGAEGRAGVESGVGASASVMGGVGTVAGRRGSD